MTFFVAHRGIGRVTSIVSLPEILIGKIKHYEAQVFGVIAFVGMLIGGFGL